MIRLNFALHRLPRVSRAEFQRYWRDVHGPLVVSVSRALGMRRYVQTHTLDDPIGEAVRAARPGMHEPFDGIASVWFDSREGLFAAMTTDEGRRAGALLLEDERRFIDLSRSPLWLCHEVPQINPMPENSIVAWPGSAWIKICYLLQPKAGMSAEECRRTWSMDHGYLIRRHSGVTGFARYIQSHLLDDELNQLLRASRDTPPPYVGLTEAWFDRHSLAAVLADAHGEGARALAAFLEDEKRFIDFARSSVWASKELVFVDERST